jgi:hypothetical protein
MYKPFELKFKLEPVEEIPEKLLKQAAPPITLGMVVAKQLMSFPGKAGKISEQELKAAYQGRRLRLNGARIRQITEGRKVRYIYSGSTKEYYFWIE